MINEMITWLQIWFNKGRTDASKIAQNSHSHTVTLLSLSKFKLYTNGSNGEGTTKKDTFIYLLYTLFFPYGRLKP